MAITEVDQVDAIGKDGNKLRLALFDILDWQYEDMHLEMLQDKLNNYILFLDDKQYVKKYGDNYEKKIIDIYFQYGITENGNKLLQVFSSHLADENIFIEIHLPEDADKECVE